MAGPARRVLVTGGNKGIGKALCQQLCGDLGFHVLLGSRDAARGAAAVESIQATDPRCKGRLELLQVDTSKDESVAAAAATVEPPLYAVVNNAGVGPGTPLAESLAVNIYGVKRVCDAFLPLLCPSTGRIVNVASASGPNYISRCSPKERSVLTNPDVTWEQIEGVIATKSPDCDAYGLTKACVNAYTMLLAREHPNLRVNSITPGFILTDMTRNMGVVEMLLRVSGIRNYEISEASKPPAEGTKAAIHCLTAELEGNGWYYGSDALRSPLDCYRSPGSPPYEGP